MNNMLFGGITSLASVGQRPFAERPDVYAMVIDSGELTSVTSKKTASVYSLLKTCVTDESHPGLHVCFWSDAATRQAKKGVRPGDIVRLVKVNGPGGDGSSSSNMSSGAAIASLGTPVDAYSGSDSNHRGRYGLQLSARDLEVVWRDGLYFNGTASRSVQHVHTAPTSVNDAESRSAADAAARVVAWAKQAWPAVCRASVYPSIQIDNSNEDRTASSGGDHESCSVNAGKGIVPVWGAVASTLSGTSHVNDNYHARAGAPLPKFYSLSDLLYGSGGINGSIDESSSSIPFRGLCLVRCSIGRVWLPPGADELAISVDDAVHDALLQSAANPPNIDGVNDDVNNAPNSSLASPSDDAIKCVATQLHLLTAKQPNTNDSSSSSSNVAYRGWFLTLVEAPLRMYHELDSGGEVGIPDDADEAAIDEEAANEGNGVEQAIMDKAKNSSNTPVEAATDEEGGPLSKKPRHLSEGVSNIPHTASPSSVHAFVGGAATQDLLGGLTPLLLSLSNAEVGDTSATATTTAAFHQRLVAARLLIALAHEATLAQSSPHLLEVPQEHSTTNARDFNSSTTETSMLATSGAAAAGTAGNTAVSKEMQRPTALWAKVWVEHDTDSAGRLKVHARAVSLAGPAALTPCYLYHNFTEPL